MEGNPSTPTKESRTSKRWQRVDHDDTCSSDDTNMKATQLSPSDLPSSEAPIPSLFEDSVHLENNTYQSTAFSPTRKYTYSLMEESSRERPHKDNIKAWGHSNLTSSSNPLSMVINSSGRHKYLIESTITTSPRGITTSHKAGEQDNKPGSAEEPEYVTSYYHRNTLGSYGFESVLSEIHNRCKNNDSINQELEKMLDTKNKQLSDNFALLEQSRNTLADIQCQFDNERKQKSLLDARLKDLEQDRQDFSKAKQQINEELSILKEELMKAKTEIAKKADIIETMSSNLSKVTSEKDVIIKDLRSSVDDMRQKQSELEERLQKEISAAEELRNTNETLRKQLAAKEEQTQSIQSQLHREEKHRKHIEKEHDLVTMQGQTLIEQQAAIRSQYEEDIQELRSKLERQEAAFQEREEMSKVHLEQVTQQAKNSNQNITLLTDNNNQLADQLKSERQSHITQGMEYQTIIKQLKDQVSDMRENEERLQKKIQMLQEQHREFENSLSTNNQELASGQVTLLAEIERLNETLTKERADWSEKEKEMLDEKHSLITKHSKSFHDYRQTAEKESIELKCRNVELEEKLDQRKATLTTMKDQIQKLTERENQTNSANLELKECMQKLLDESQKHLAEKENEIQQLSASMVTLEKESKRNIEDQEKVISDLNKKLADVHDQRQELEERCADLRSSLQEARRASDQVQCMRALISKKESSKAILTAEQQRIEREYSAALLDKESEVNNLEQEVRHLQRENMSLRKMKESNATTIAGVQVPEASIHSVQTNDVGRTGMARKHSSNIILSAENHKLKSELKNAEMWWQRDINELQKRYTTQLSTMSEMERRMTFLESENSHLKLLSDRSMQQIRSPTADSSKELTQASITHEKLLEQYRQELTVKENKIKHLEASLRVTKGDTSTALRLLESASEQEHVVKAGLQEQLAQNEADMVEIKLNLQEAEQAITSQDSRALQLLHKSTTQLDLLLENTKCANKTATSTLEVSAEKQSSFLKLHQKFVQTLAQIQKDATISSSSQKLQFEELQKFYDDQIAKINESMSILLQAKADEVSELQKRNTQLMAMLNEAKQESTKFGHEIEKEQAKSSRTENTLKLLEKRLQERDQAENQLRATIQEQSTQLTMANTNASLDKDKSLTKMKIRYEDLIGKEFESHKKELQMVTNRLKASETENTNLQEHINKLQSKLCDGSKDLESEVQDLHGKLNSLLSEKAALQDQFNDSLQSLRTETELTLKEKNQQIHRQNCQIAELEAKCKSTLEEMAKGKLSNAELQRTVHNDSRMHLDEINKLKLQLQNYETKIKDLSEIKLADKKQITLVLEELTKREIENVKQNNMLKQLYDSNQNNKKEYEIIIAQLESDLNNKSALLKKANSNIKQLKLALKSSEHELQLAEERLLLIKTDLKHVESISNMYRSEAGQLANGSYSKFRKTESPFQRPGNSQDGCIQLFEQASSDGLGCKVAELANELALKNKQLDVQNLKLKEYLDKNINLAETATTLSRQKEDLEITICKIKQEAKKLQQQLEQQLRDNDSLKEDQARSMDEMTSLQRQLNEKGREAEALQKKMSSTKLLQAESSYNCQKFDALSQTALQLRQKLESEREGYLITERKLLSQAASMSKETSSLRTQLDEAYNKNQGLERYIKHLRRSYGQLFDDKEPATTYIRLSTSSAHYCSNEPTRRQSDT